jgi:hypothetical protein
VTGFAQKRRTLPKRPALFDRGEESSRKGAKEQRAQRRKSKFFFAPYFFIGVLGVSFSAWRLLMGEKKAHAKARRSKGRKEEIDGSSLRLYSFFAPFA